MKSTNAMLDMDIKPGKLDISSKQAKLSRDYVPARSGVTSSAVVVEIDQYPSRAAYGMKSAMDATKEMAQEALQKVKDATASIASEGTQVAKYGHKRNVFADIAKGNITELKNRVLTLGEIPAPTITVRPSEIVGENDVGKDEVTIEPSPVEYSYQPVEISYYLKQKPSIQFWTSEGKYDINA